ncbi:hypothetical protein [Streptomyces hokutonensis]
MPYVPAAATTGRGGASTYELTAATGAGEGGVHAADGRFASDRLRSS